MKPQTIQAAALGLVALTLPALPVRACFASLMLDRSVAVGSQPSASW